jgi:hypothetical protein
MSLFSGKSEKELQAVRRDLERQKSDLDQREQIITRREQLADERDRDLNVQEASLLTRDQEVKKAEAEARSAFAANCREDFRELFERWKAELDKREASLKEYEDRLAAQARDVMEKDGRAAERERQVTERELRADAGFADRNRALLEEVARGEGACRQQEERLRGWEEEQRQRSEALARRDDALTTRERAVQQREIEADAGFAQRNHDALAALAERREALVQELQALEDRLRGEEQSRRQALDRTLEQHAEEQRRRVEAQRATAIAQLQEVEEKNRAALARFEARHAELLAEIETLSGEVHKRRMEQFQRLEDELRTEAERRHQELARNLEQERAAALAIRQAEEEARRQEIAHQQGDLSRQRDEISRLRDALGEREIALQRRDLELRTREAMVVEGQHQLGRRVEESVATAVADLQRRCERRESTIEDLRQECSALEQRLEAYDDMRRRLENQEPEQVLQRLREQRAEIEAVRRELAERPSPDLKDRLAGVTREKAVFQEQCKRVTQEVIQLKAERARWHAHANELEVERTYREAADRRCETFAALNKVLREQLEQFRRIVEKPKERQERIDEIEKHPHFQSARPADEPVDEQAWLQNIEQRCVDSGLIFPRRLLHAFHTSLKAGELSTLTVLAGVSGTGKSKLPDVYARFGGLNFLSLPVRPDWDSPQSIFGFYNSVENRFNPLPLLKAIAQFQRPADQADGLSDQLLLVLLDEMNLAYVELYFSDLLSKLEDRRGKDRETLLIDLGGGLQHPIELGRNVLWSGTMNEDENTKSLSDKVLDRGNIIFFPRPKHLKRRETLELAEPSPTKLRWDTWNTWVVRESPFEKEHIQPFMQVLDQMNECLERVGRALGHRVWQSVEYYMANHPAVSVGSQDDLEKGMRLAFEDQIAQKVMPKLRGIETSGGAQKACLDPIRQILDGFGLRLTEDFDLACKLGHGSFLWKSARFLEDGL